MIFKKHLLFLLAALMLCFQSIGADNSSLTSPVGPLQGRQESFGHTLLFASVPRGARVAEQGSFQAAGSVFVVQDYIMAYHPENIQKSQNQIFDYEMLGFRQDISFVPFPGLEAGFSVRGNYFSGGVMDTFIEEFHGLFGFPNAGREFYPRDEIWINFNPSTVDPIMVASPVWSLNSVAFWGRYHLGGNDFTDIALLLDWNVPLGQYMSDIAIPISEGGAGIAVDIFPNPYLSIYLQAGVIMPLFSTEESVDPLSVNPRFQSIFSLEVKPLPWLAFHGQLDFMSSPYSGGSLYNTKIEVPLNDFFGNPVLGILVGGRFNIGDHHGIELYVWEDIYTLTSADVVLSICYRYSRVFDLES